MQPDFLQRAGALESSLPGEERMSTVYEMAEVYCVVCGDPVPPERKKKRSITCCDRHAKQRKDSLRERKELRKCKYCGTPSTPEERDDFRLWRRERKAAALKAASNGSNVAPIGAEHENQREINPSP